MADDSGEGSGDGFFWYQMHNNFFEHEAIRFLRSHDNWTDYIVFYQMLILKGLNTDGKLRYSETKAFDDRLLSISTGFDIETVNSAMPVLIEAELVEREEDGTLFLPKLKNMVGKQSKSARKRQEQRANLAEKEENDKCRTEKDIQSDEDEEEYRQGVGAANGSQKVFHRPTIEEVEAYCNEKGYEVNAERFWAFYGSKGWMVGSAPMIDWKTAVYRFSLHEDY